MRLFSSRQSQTPGRRSMNEAPVGSSEKQREQAFRRGRTLTGSPSSRIRSANELQADLKSSRVHTHELSKKRRRVGSLLFSVLLLIGFFTIVLYQFTGSVVVRASPDPSLKLDQGYSSVIEAYLADHPAERLRFFLNLNRLSAYVQAQTPEIESVAVDGFAGLGVSSFSLTVRRPVASWEVNGKQLYVDDSGVPFNRNYYISPSLTVADRSGVPITSGQTIASNRFMAFIGQFIGEAKERGYDVSGITIPPNMTRQIEVSIRGENYPIKFSSERGAGEGVEDMVRALEWIKGRNITPRYVDVRVAGKAYYQ